MKYRILEILKIYDSGFTLLGDNCQAIYDFQSEEMSSKEFYKELYETFKEMEEIEYKIPYCNHMLTVVIIPTFNLYKNIGKY